MITKTDMKEVVKWELTVCGNREVAQKIKYIISSYYPEVKKIANSKKSGASADDIWYISLGLYGFQ